MDSFDTRLFRDTLGEFPTGVTIVTTYNNQKEPVGMTANSFASVSLDPPLILWSVDKNASVHDVYTNAKRFSVHVLSDLHKSISNHFATMQGDRFRDIEWEKGASGAPILTDCTCRLHCITEAVFPGGDHSIVLGKVIGFDQGEGHHPLLFHKGQYKKLQSK